MSWQELAVAIIVALAVVSLYRHLRDLLGSAKPSAHGQASCHGCDDCEDDAETDVPTPSDPAALHPPSTRVH